MDDVNEQAVEGWVEDTEPVERVWAVIKHVDDAATVDEIASRARVSDSDARELLGQMSAIGIVESDSDGYRMPIDVGLALEACRLLDRADADQIEDSLGDLRAEPDPDETTRRNRAIAEVAVAISEAGDELSDISSE